MLGAGLTGIDEFTSGEGEGDADTGGTGEALGVELPLEPGVAGAVVGGVVTTSPVVLTAVEGVGL